MVGQTWIIWIIYAITTITDPIKWFGKVSFKQMTTFLFQNLKINEILSEISTKKLKFCFLTDFLNVLNLKRNEKLIRFRQFLWFIRLIRFKLTCDWITMKSRTKISTNYKIYGLRLIRINGVWLNIKTKEVDISNK